MKKIHFILKSTITLVVLSLCFASEMQAQTPAPTDFYPIIMVNTSDASIGGITIKPKLEGMFDDISIETGMTKHLTVIPYPFKYSDFQAAVNNIPNNSSSVVMLYVFDHSENAVGSSFPLVGFSEGDKSFSDMHQMLKNRDNRLTVSIIEACNHGGGQANLTVGSHMTEYYKELFSDTKGDVIACSSKQGQYSLASTKGGNFGNVLLTNIQTTGDWNTLSQKVNDQTKAEATKFTCEAYRVACNCDSDRCNQEPYWEINVTLDPSGIGNTRLEKYEFSYEDSKSKGLSIPSGITEKTYRDHQFEYQLKEKGVSEAEIKKIVDTLFEISSE